MAAKRETRTEDINEEVIFKHNLLVDHLSVHMVEDDFQSLKNLFKDCPLTPKDLINITTVQELFVKLMKNENISIGHYEYFTERLEKVDKSLASYVRREEQQLKDILNAGLSPTKRVRIEQESIQQSNSDSNINPVGAERVSQLMESFISAAVPGQTESSASSENAVAIANPEIFCGAVANPTTGNCNQLTVIYNDLREYKDEFNIETMKVRHAENLSIGEQTVLPPGDPPVAGRSAASSSHSQKIHSDLLPIIETTISMIKTEKEKEIKFMPTKAYHDAQEKLRKNRVLVIKGNTGDGKTSTAFQLVHWLMEELQCRKPVKIDEIKDLKLIAPNSGHACIIDDIFGERDIGRLDVQEWNKKLKNVETLFVSKQNQTNYLLITIRNEIFNVFAKNSRGTVFTKDNIIDLSSNKYKIKGEKQKLLAMYTPTNLTWTEEEEEQILGYAPHIGFPQCCQLFYNSVELQKKRADFFEKPVQFFIEALSNLPECPAILFLFLNGGEIKVNDLDPNEVNKTLLEQAFRIKLVNSEVRTKREYEEKVDFVRESLDNELLGFLVKKEKHWSGEEVYRFDHDSIYVTVALLYGKKTPVGYIKHCPRKALSYLTTVETSTDMVVISSRHYNDLCERLLREFERVERYGYGVIGSLHVLTEPVILEIFDKYLDEKKANKLNILNKACGSGLVKLALYLLKRGVKPDKDTMLHVARGGSMDLYNTVRQYGVTPTGRDEDGKNVLHVACLLQRLSIVGDLCVDYPHLVHGTDRYGLTPLHMAAMTGNCSMFQTVEKTVLKSLCRVEDEQHQCEREEDCLVHRHCVCSQYMCQLVDRVWGRMTVLHLSCWFGCKDLSVYICRTYPAMTACVDSGGRHCLHYIANDTTDIDMFIEIESYVRKHTETLKQYHDIKTILNGEGKSVLDMARGRGTANNPLYDHLLGVFSK